MGHLTDLAVGVVAFLPCALRGWSLGTSGLDPRGGSVSVGWVVALCGISVNYLMHGAIWVNPKKFASMCGSSPLAALGAHPVDVFSKLELVVKVLQLSCVAATLSTPAASLVDAARAAPTWCWLVALVYAGVGQSLNAAMYAAIGNDGVYYGFKLGRTVPWCTGFPFNVGLRHPQYVGVVLTLWGALAVLQSEALAADAFPLLVVCWASMYIGMSAMEQLGDRDAKSED